ncbi:MAG TPA: protein kinase [Polyangiaceae bacterium]|jgi:tetratricopeptide (TPR) repeat protein
MQRGVLLRGRFEIREVVQEGGMGLVFRAHDRETNRPVAVKTLIDPAPQHAERFARETALLASLRHPAVVSHVDHGFSEKGEPYLVMDWLEGEELGDRIARGPLSETDARALALRMAEALGAAHALGIVHRDVKPANVVLVENDVARATLIDFGVALAGGPRRTRSGLVVGTPGYMAPEQARARRDVDARADVYALGCVLWECLTGKPPFTGEHAVAILAKVLLEETPRLRAIAPGAPADLDALLARMLAKDPAARPRDGEEVARALREAKPGQSSHAPSVMPPSLGDDERVVVHIILAAKSGDDPFGRTLADHELAAMHALEEQLGVHIDVLADGSAVATVKPGAAGPKGGALRAAAVARALARETKAPVALASGLQTLRRGLPIGEVVDRAAALARAAANEPAGTVVLDELSATLLRGAWNVIERDGRRVLDDEPVRAAAARPIVGRDRELQTLMSLAEEVEAEGVSRVAMVSAPPGGGKTRVANELLDRIRAREGGARIWTTRCDETTSRAALALAGDIARLACGATSADDPDALRERLASRVMVSPLAAEAKRRVLDFVGEMIGATTAASLALLAARTDAMTMSDQTQRAFVDLLRAACEGGTVVLVIDDLQWCDRASFRLLEAAARELEGKPLLLLVLARPDFDETFPTAFAERALTRLALSALGKRAAESLVRDVAGDRATDAVVAELVARGEGNPFMLEELARGAREGRSLEAAGGTTALVASRFESLSAEARRAMRAASIIGQQFSGAAVAALLACEVGAPWLAAALAELERAEVIASGDLAFRHALLRDAAYATLTAEDQKLGHELAARFFETARAEAIVIAQHAERGGDRELAARAYVDAAQRALEASDLAGALERANAAAQSGASGASLARAERVATEACFWLGSLREVTEHAARVMNAVGPDEPNFFVAGGFAVIAHARLGETDAALETTKRLLTTPAAAGVVAAARASALLEAASMLALSGQLDLGKAILRELAPRVAELAAVDPHVPARYARTRSICAMASGDLGKHIAGAAEAAKLFAELGDRRNDLMQRAVVAYGLLEVGDWAASARAGRAVIAEASQMDLRSVVAMTKQNAGFALAFAGERDEGIRMLREAAAESAAQGHARMAGGAHLYLAIVHAESGELDAALAELERALEALRSAPPARAHALAVLARVRIDRGEIAEGKRAADEALAVLDSLGGVDSGETDVYLAAARAKLASGEEASGRAVLKRGRDRLRARAAKLGDAERTTFLEHVPANVALLALAAETLGEDSTR